MHRSRHSTHRIAGPLRAASAHADHWTAQIDRLKESLRAPVLADTGAGALTETGAQPETSGFFEPAGSAEKPIDSPSWPGPDTSRFIDSRSPDTSSVIASDLRDKSSVIAPDPPDTSSFQALGLQAAQAAAGVFDEPSSGAIDWPASAQAQPAFVDDQSSASNMVRAVERSTASDATGESSGADNTGGSPGNTQEPAALLTETNQQLELIRQTLEKILAKPGSVVLD
jgi:hypothetical protein